MIGVKYPKETNININIKKATKREVVKIAI